MSQRAQRVVVIIAMLLAACILHYRLCSWESTHAATVTNPVLFSYEVQPSMSPTAGSSLVKLIRSKSYFSGLFASEGVSVAEATTLGVVVPIVLILAATACCLEWRHRDRVASGLCAGCGHDLGQNRKRCPECGREHGFAAREAECVGTSPP